MMTNSSSIAAKINFEKAGYFFLVLIPLAVLGFWKSYFSKLFASDNNFGTYFHFHAVLMALWIVFLIVQPALIRAKKYTIHRINGRISFILMPLILVSILLMLHSGGKADPPEQQGFAYFAIPVVLFFIVSGFYVVALLNRHNVNIHARSMIATGIAFLDPTLMRFIGPPTIGIIFAVVIALIILERKQKSGRWVFPSLLGALAIMYAPLLIYLAFNKVIAIPPLDGMMKWFFSLPLT